MAAVPKPVMILKMQIQTQVGAFQNLLYYEPPSGILSTAQMTAVANAAFTTLSPLYSGVLNNACAVVGAFATYTDGTNEYMGVSTIGAVVGALENTLLPDQNAVVIRKLTDLAGRQNRGRWYIGGLDSSVIGTTNNNEIATTALAGFQSLAAAMVSDQTWDGLLFHARLWNRKGSTLEPIAEAQVASRLATQRARRRHSPDFGE
jgi:hypothetical protein